MIILHLPAERLDLIVYALFSIAIFPNSTSIIPPAAASLTTLRRRWETLLSLLAQRLMPTL